MATTESSAVLYAITLCPRPPLTHPRLTSDQRSADQGLPRDGSTRSPGPLSSLSVVAWVAPVSAQAAPLILTLCSDVIWWISFNGFSYTVYQPIGSPNGSCVIDNLMFLLLFHVCHALVKSQKTRKDFVMVFIRFFTASFIAVKSLTSFQSKRIPFQATALLHLQNLSWYSAPFSDPFYSRYLSQTLANVRETPQSRVRWT